MKLSPWSIPLVCGVLVGCGKDGAVGEGVFSARTPDVAAPQVEGVSASVDGGAQGGQGADDPGALRGKLKILAVTSECLRRGNAPAEEVATTMLALYKTHGVDLDTYAREMGRLGGDAGFQSEVQAELAKCPETAPVSVAEVADVNDEEEVTVVADDVAAMVEDAGEDAGPEAPEPDADEQGPPDVAENADVEVAPAVTPDKAAPDWSGTWTGALKGSVSGTLRVTVRGRSVSSASMSWGGKSVRLQGTVASNGHLSLGGRINTADFVRLRGRINAAGKSLSGTWDGVIERKRVQGSLSLTR